MLSVFVLLVLEYSAADTLHKLLDRAVSAARFLTDGVFESVTLLIVDLWQYCECFINSGVTYSTLFMMLYLCRMYQCGLHVRGAVVEHLYTYLIPRCRTSQYCRTFISLSVSLPNDVADVGIFTAYAYSSKRIYIINPNCLYINIYMTFTLIIFMDQLNFVNVIMYCYMHIIHMFFYYMYSCMHIM